MLHFVLLPALALSDKAYQLRIFGSRAQELLALLAALPAAAPGVECASCFLWLALCLPAGAVRWV